MLCALELRDRTARSPLTREIRMSPAIMLDQNALQDHRRHGALPSAKTRILLNAKATGLDTTQDEINWRWRLSTRFQAVLGLSPNGS